MRAQLMVLDCDPRVTGLAGRPVRLLWRESRGRVRTWTPQLFARYNDGTALLADCPSHPDAGGERALNAAAAMELACAQVGFTYRRLLPLYPAPAANLKWLAGYRHPATRAAPGSWTPSLKRSPRRGRSRPSFQRQLDHGRRAHNHGVPGRGVAGRRERGFLPAKTGLASIPVT